MPDWQRLVREKLGRLRLSEGCEQEVVEELASHLEDAFQAGLSAGLSEQEAESAALAAVCGWRKLVGSLATSP